MKIIQVNAWMGRLLPSLIRFIIEQEPDIVCAQEIFSSTTANPLTETNQTLEQIEKSCNFKHTFFSPTFTFESFGAKVSHGNAIFSKHPLIDTQTFFTSNQYAPIQTADNFVRNIRNLQICQVNVGGKNKIIIANHHGYHELNEVGSEKTKVSLDKLSESLNNVKYPLILCGDFNVVSSSPYFEPLKSLNLRNLTVENKISTTLSAAHRIASEKEVACDYIMCSDDINVRDFSASEKLVSDHKALILEFDI
jgi:endonuclease/exonuclease/phosphatase family metal-dependent hydrolase